jgi:hypothetical protein
VVLTRTSPILASIEVDRQTFVVAKRMNPFDQYNPVFPLGSTNFTFGVGVTVRLSPQRLLHDSLGTTPANQFSYPTGSVCDSGC